MTGCSALFCNNSSDKGYVMKVFPKDAKRRAEWTEKVGRKDWTPSDRCYLCEVHFTPDAWENRADGKPKLRPNAVPTVFGHWLKKRSWNTRQNEESQQSGESCTATCTNNDVGGLPTELKADNASSSTNNEDDSIKIIEHYEKLIEKQKNINIKLAKDVFILRKKLKASWNAYRKHEKKFSKDKCIQALKRIFNEDQIRALFTKRRTTRNWSKDTIRRALRLKFTCGTNGYEELLRQNIPLPSLRTLRRKLENS